MNTHSEDISRETLWAYASADVRAAVAEELRYGRPDRLLDKAAAGLAVICAEQLKQHYGGVYGRRVVLLVGTGNNGADALLAGVLLRRRGVRIDAILTGESAYLPGIRKLTAARGNFIYSRDITHAKNAVCNADLIVDGIVGESGVGGLRGFAGELVTEIPREKLVIAVDLPSGVDPDCGEISGQHVRADMTVVFGAWKPCLLLPPASDAAGKLRFVDVRLPAMTAKPLVRRLGAREISASWPVPDRNAHKYSRGVVGIIAGSRQYPGAAVLAALGAVQSGAAGITRFIGPDTVTAHVLNAVPEIVPGKGPVDAWLLGSGVTDDPEQDRAIESALHSGLPCVVDAGALHACVQARRANTGLAPADRLVLTPHLGELARMLEWIDQPATPADIAANPRHYGIQVARALDATTLIKGPVTLIVRPDGLTASQNQAPAWLATAGAGDVLAGILAALLAAGLCAFDAAELAAYIHGRAATHSHGQNHAGPLTASAVAHALPAVIGQTIQPERQFICGAD